MNYEKGFNRMATAFCVLIAVVAILDLIPLFERSSFYEILSYAPTFISNILRGDLAKGYVLEALITVIIYVKSLVWIFIKVTQWIVSGFKDEKLKIKEEV